MRTITKNARKETQREKYQIQRMKMNVAEDLASDIYPSQLRSPPPLVLPSHSPTYTPRGPIAPPSNPPQTKLQHLRLASPCPILAITESPHNQRSKYQILSKQTRPSQTRYLHKHGSKKDKGGDYKCGYARKSLAYFFP